MTTKVYLSPRDNFVLLSIYPNLEETTIVGFATREAAELGRTQFSVGIFSVKKK